MSPQSVVRAQASPKRNKYGNRRTVVDGMSFASAAEARRWCALKLLERAGQIRDLERQVWFTLTVNGVKICAYVADHQYVDTATGQTIVEDVKGYATDVFRIKQRLMKAVLNIDVKEVA